MTIIYHLSKLGKYDFPWNSLGTSLRKFILFLTLMVGMLYSSCDIVLPYSYINLYYLTSEGLFISILMIHISKGRSLTNDIVVFVI